MSDERWKRLEVVIDARAVEEVGAFLFTKHALGVEIQDQTTFGAAAIPEGKARIISFFDEATVEFELSSFDPDHVAWSAYDDVSWRESWKAFFKPALISDRLIVGPPWESFEAPENGHKVVIEPGMAFGTGTHETTTLCAGLMDRLCGDSPPSSLFDVGCGSGILSIAAKKLGVDKVIGVDIEEESIRISRENVQINQVEAHFDTEWPDQRFEFVIANILANILLAIRGEIFDHLDVEGTLIVSGITVEQIDRFIEQFVPPDRKVCCKEVRGDWVALVIQ